MSRYCTSLAYFLEKRRNFPREVRIRFCICTSLPKIRRAWLIEPLQVFILPRSEKKE